MQEKIQGVETVHFIGLGGIGMSALARILLQRGVPVQGSDLKQSQLLDELKKEGAVVQIGHSAEFLANATQVVYSTDVKQENVEIRRAHELQLLMLHRSDLLHALFQGKMPLLVTGTHGKTTVSSLLTSALFEAGFDPSFVIGGIHRKWRTNGRAGGGGYFVAEADESDGSFLKTPSFGGIVTNLENDHLDFWKTSEKLDEAFKRFFDQAIHEKHLFWCGDDFRLKNLLPKGVSYGFNKENELWISSWEATETGVRFDLEWRHERFESIDLRLFGRHNVLNGAAVFGLCLSLGAPEKAIRKAFLEFAGTVRRLDFKGSAHAVEVYDDYGHHPTEIAATLKALRTKIREKRLVAVFQPHRFTRVRDLFDSFLTCFDEADVVAMTDIYSAGEMPIDGITSAALYARMRDKLGQKLYFFTRSHLEAGVAQLLGPHDVVLTLGAGDVTKAGEPILQLYKERAPKWTIGVLFGGTSSEHAVSLMSARTIIEGLDRCLYDVKLFGLTKQGEWLTGPDVLEKLEQKISFAPGTQKISSAILDELSGCDAVFPVFHGRQGEDGMIQGLLDTLNIAYVGCDYSAGALCMHKGWTKHIARVFGIATSHYIEFDSATFRKAPELLLQTIDEELGLPIWMKPVHLGSSIGVVRVEKREEILKAAQDIFALDDTLIAEEEIDGREVEFSILGNEMVRVAPAGEIMKKEIFHGYDNKYGAGASEIRIPALLTDSQRIIGEELALEMYRKVGCKGLARIDFFIDRNGHFWLNEINPFPGFTKTSAFPKVWEAAGLSIRELLDELLILAMHRHRRFKEIRGK